MDANSKYLDIVTLKIEYDTILSKVAPEHVQDVKTLLDKKHQIMKENGIQQVSEKYGALRDDEKILDSLFDRTKYGKIIENMASGIAEGIIQGLSAGNSIDSAVSNLNIKEAVSEIRGENEKTEKTENKKGRCR